MKKIKTDCMKPIVVGIDPGTYIGIAIFDLKMNLIRSTTITDKGKEAVVSEIIKFGNPIVVASDVSPPPTLVTQIASYFNARLFYPKSIISDYEKKIEASKYIFNSVHERDAIIAVLYFFKEHTNKLRWIERILKEKGLTEIEEEVKRYALSGIRVDDAIKILSSSSEENRIDDSTNDSKGSEANKVYKQVERQKRDRDMMLSLLESNVRLRSRLSILEEELKRLSKSDYASVNELRASLFSKDMKIRRLKRLIRIKNNKIRKLYRILNSIRSKNEIRKEKEKNLDEGNRETEEQKDLKNEETTLSIEKIVKEYRESRYK